MRSFFSASAGATAVLIMMAAIAIVSTTGMRVVLVDAQVGQDQDGRMFQAGVDKYLMCGKCNYARYSGASLTIPSYWKLVCTGDKTTNDTFAWINWDCEAGCTTCKERVNITTGALIKARYNEEYYYESSWFSSIKSGQVAASFQCCPRVAATTAHADSTCSDVVKRVTYAPSGCTGSNTPGRTSWSGSYCETSGGPPANLHLDCTAASGLYTGDACPSDTSTCTATFSLSNSPCLAVSGVSGLYGSTTVNCEVDGTQMCLRAVDYDYYYSNMSTGYDVEDLECLPLGASTATMSLSAMIVVMVVAFFSASA